ncbi:MAG: 50S ribosome-binding GTPase, partial [Nitrosomonadales bacterium]|nr:50S ribosome-binding GTPase [Nitrosomonadales bacterium]
SANWLQDATPGEAGDEAPSAVERGDIVISDTVGFIRHLPHSLVAAFRGTLEEAAQADLLLHVVDANNAMRDDQIAEVNKVLTEIGAAEIPQILVFNKIDLSGVQPSVQRDDYGRIDRIFLSARTGEGLDELRQALIEAKAGRQAAIQAEQETN